MLAKALRKRSRAITSRQRRLFVEPLEARLCLSVPAYSSLPGANHTILLDFDGHTTQGTTWNSSYGINTIVSPPYDTNGNPSTYSASELAVIEAAWKWVAEDFAPFQVNVTTVDPGAAALSYSGSGDTQWGVRVVITDDTFAGCGCGGHAWLGSFDDPTDEPVFVYNKSLTGVSEASSHEVGHALSLSHDGYSGGAYYGGHGSGATSWGPLMGVSYNRNVSQWSKGEYYTANNSQDDLAIITSLTNGNGFGYRADDHGNNNGSATVLSSAGGAISASGLISTTGDVDVFSFNTGAGNVSININPAATGPNLDILARLYDSSGSLVATSDSPSVLSASFNLSLQAGLYYLHVDGTGVGTPLVNPPSGYTEYGSLGKYSLSGTVVDPGGLPALTINDVTRNEFDGTAVFTVTLSGTVTNPVSVQFATANGSALAGSDYVSTSGTLNFSAAGSQTITVMLNNDSLSEPTEDFVVNLSNATNAILADSQGTGTILDDDAEIVIDDISGNEGNLTKGKNGGNPQLKDFVFTVSLTTAVQHVVTVNYATADGTATTADNDYLSTSGSLTFQIGETSKTITVTVIGDTNTGEGDETFSVVLSSPVGASFGDSTGVGTILDDDTKGGKGGGKGNGGKNIPGEIELQDPIWWFEGASHMHGHDLHELLAEYSGHGDHDHDADEFDEAFAWRPSALASLASARQAAQPGDDLDEPLYDGGADLQAWQPVLFVMTDRTRSAAEEPVEGDRQPLHEALVDQVFDELGEVL